jgi:hypothetical protein
MGPNFLAFWAIYLLEGKRMGTLSFSGFGMKEKDIHTWSDYRGDHTTG